MNWDRIEGNWRQLKGNVMQQCGKVTGDHFYVCAGRCEHLAGRIQESRGIARDQMVKQHAVWLASQK